MRTTSFAWAYCLAIFILLPSCGGRSAPVLSQKPPSSDNEVAAPAAGWQAQLPQLPQDGPVPGAEVRAARGVFTGAAGDDCYSKTSDATAPQAGELALEAPAGKLSYAFYRFPAEAQATLLSVDVALTARSTPDSPVYIAAASYKLGRWTFGATPDGNSFNVPLAGGPGDCVSPGGYFYVGVMVYDGDACTVSRVSIEASRLPAAPGGWQQDGGGKQRWGLAGVDITDELGLEWSVPAPAAIYSWVPSRPVVTPGGQVVVPDLYADTGLKVYDSQGGEAASGGPGLGRSVSPAAGPDGTVYAVSPAGVLEAFQPGGGSVFSYAPAGTKVKAFVLDDDGRVYLRTTQGLAALSPEGALLWETPLQNPGGRLLLGRDGTLYCSSGSNLAAFSSGGTALWSDPPWAGDLQVLSLDGSGIYRAAPGSLALLNLDSTVQVEVAYPQLQQTLALALTPDGLLAAVCEDDDEQRYLRVFGADCQLLHELPLPETEAQLLTDADGDIVLVGSRGSVSAFETDLTPQWVFSLPGALFLGAAVGPQGQLYIYDGHGQLYSLSSGQAAPGVPGNVSATDGTLYGTVRVSWDAVSCATGYQIYRDGVLAGTGGYAPEWHDPAPAVGQTYSYSVEALNAWGTGLLSLPDTGWAADPGTNSGFWCTPWADSANSGSAATTGPRSAGALELLHGAALQLLTCSNGDLVVIESTVHESYARAVGLDSTGAERWRYDFPAPLATNAALGPQAQLCVALGDQSVVLLDMNGVLLWRSQVWADQPSRTLSPPVFAPNDNICLYGYDTVYTTPGHAELQQHAFALDPAGGLLFDTLLISVFAGAHIIQAPLTGSDSHIYLPACDGDGLLALDSGGGFLGRVAQGIYPLHPPCLARDAVNGDRLYLIRENMLYSYRPDGTLAWQAPGPPGLSGQPAVFGTPAISPLGAVVAYAGLGVSAFDPADGDVLWSNPGDWWDGSGTDAPLVDGAGYVYVGVRPEVWPPGSPGGPPFVPPQFTCVAPDGTTAWQLEGTYTQGMALSPGGELYLLLPDGLNVLQP